MDNNFNQKQWDLLVGSLLGDANLQTFTNGRTWRARFLHKAVHQPYIEHKYLVLKDFCLQKPVYSECLDARTGKTYCRFWFNTSMSEKFRFLAHLFYKKNNSNVWLKGVPHSIFDHLTPRALAYWYMDDGALKWKGVSNSVRFCTDSFVEPDVLLLKDVLVRKFGLKCSIQKKNSMSRLSVLEESYWDLNRLVVPYLLPCMYYKFPDGKRGVLNDEDISKDVRNTFND